MMILGTDQDGRDITYDEARSRFAIGGIATTPDRILAYDRGGHVTWASTDMRGWVTETDRVWRQTAENRDDPNARRRAEFAAQMVSKGAESVELDGYDPQKIRRLAGTLGGLALIIVVVFTLVGVVQGFIVGVALNATGGFPAGLAILPVLFGALWFGAGYLASLGLKVADAALVSLVQIESNTRST